MKQRRRIYYSAAQRSEIWDRWQAGEPMSSIGRRFDRESSSVFSVISPTGPRMIHRGVAPRTRLHQPRVYWVGALLGQLSISASPAGFSTTIWRCVEPKNLR